MKEILNKKNIIIVISVLLILILLLGLTINNKKKTDMEKPQLIDKKIVVDGLSFNDAIISNENGLYVYTVKVKNTTKEDYKLNYILFKLYDKNEKEITKIIGYVGDQIKKGDTVKVTSNVDIDIRDAKKIKIEIK